MKKQTLLSVALLSLLVVGAIALVYAGKPPKILEASQVKFLPKHIDMGNMDTIQVQIKLFDGNGQNQLSVVEEIDPDTVMLEGVGLQDAVIEYNAAGEPVNFIAEFNGAAVKGMLWGIIGHMIPQNARVIPVELTVTGQLYDTTEWEGSGTVILLNFRGTSAPPPLPPP